MFMSLVMLILLTLKGLPLSLPFLGELLFCSDCLLIGIGSSICLLKITHLSLKMICCTFCLSCLKTLTLWITPATLGGENLEGWNPLLWILDFTFLRKLACSMLHKRGICRMLIGCSQVHQPRFWTANSLSFVSWDQTTSQEFYWCTYQTPRHHYWATFQPLCAIPLSSKRPLWTIIYNMHPITHLQRRIPDIWMTQTWMTWWIVDQPLPHGST